MRIKFTLDLSKFASGLVLRSQYDPHSICESHSKYFIFHRWVPLYCYSCVTNVTRILCAVIGIKLQCDLSAISQLDDGNDDRFDRQNRLRRKSCSCIIRSAYELILHNRISFASGKKKIYPTSKNDKYRLNHPDLRNLDVLPGRAAL